MPPKSPPLELELVLDVFAHFAESAWSNNLDGWIAKPGSLECGGEAGMPGRKFSFELRGGKGRCDGRWVEWSWVPSSLRLEWATRATLGRKTRICIEVDQQSDDRSHVRLTHKDLPTRESWLEHQRMWPEALKLIEGIQARALPDYTRKRRQEAGLPPLPPVPKPEPAQPPKVEPGFWFWGSVPVRIIKTADGGLDAERFDRSSANFTRDLSMISEIYFNPGGSAPIQRVGQAEFDRRVEGLRRKLGRKG